MRLLLSSRLEVFSASSWSPGSSLGGLLARHWLKSGRMVALADVLGTTRDAWLLQCRSCPGPRRRVLAVGHVPPHLAHVSTILIAASSASATSATSAASASPGRVRTLLEHPSAFPPQRLALGIVV